MKNTKPRKDYFLESTYSKQTSRYDYLNHTDLFVYHRLLTGNNAIEASDHRIIDGCYLHSIFHELLGCAELVTHIAEQLLALLQNIEVDE